MRGVVMVAVLLCATPAAAQSAWDGLHEAEVGFVVLGDGASGGGLSFDGRASLLGAALAPSRPTDWLAVGDVIGLGVGGGGSDEPAYLHVWMRVRAEAGVAALIRFAPRRDLTFRACAMWEVSTAVDGEGVFLPYAAARIRVGAAVLEGGGGPDLVFGSAGVRLDRTTFALEVERATERATAFTFAVKIAR